MYIFLEWSEEIFHQPYPADRVLTNVVSYSPVQGLNDLRAELVIISNADARSYSKTYNHCCIAITQIGLTRYPIRQVDFITTDMCYGTVIKRLLQSIWILSRPFNRIYNEMVSFELAIITYAREVWVWITLATANMITLRQTLMSAGLAMLAKRKS